MNSYKYILLFPEEFFHMVHKTYNRLVFCIQIYLIYGLKLSFWLFPEFYLGHSDMMVFPEQLVTSK
jgi:hypothetical protein